MSGKGAGLKPCPICARPAQERYKPFCSARCANVDLSRWLNESYRVPSRPEADEEERPGDAREGDGEHE